MRATFYIKTTDAIESIVTKSIEAVNFNEPPVKTLGNLLLT